MPSSKQSERRKLAKLRAEFQASPWAIDARAMGVIGAAMESGDLEAIRASLMLGGDCESTTKIINGIAVIPVSGVLRDEVDFMVRWGAAGCYQLIERDFNQAMDNQTVKGVLFYFNTPGGSAIGCKRVADIIFDGRGEKPIRAFVQGICGSAGFYMAAACDRIESTADSLVGSIGTIMPHQEYSGWLKELGINATVFTNAESPKKGHGNIYEPLSDEARKSLQSFVDSYGRPFINDVARYRGITPEDVIANYGQGEAIRADVAIKKGVIDAVVESFQESLDSITNAAGSGPSANTEKPAAVAANLPRSSTMNERIKAQLFALGLIDSLTASDEVCNAALKAWCGARGQALPSDETQVLAALQAPQAAVAAQNTGPAAEVKTEPAANVQAAHNNEQGEARLENLKAAAALVNETIGSDAVTAEMVLESATQKQSVKDAMASWKTTLAEKEAPLATSRVKVTGEGADRYAADVVDALVARAGNNIKLSDNAANLLNRPLWAVACECLNLAGHKIDMYGDREFIAEQAMTMGVAPGMRHTFYSERENRKYLQASASPAMRPGDFPNILSSLSRKYLDTVELDDDYSYPEVSAVLPGGLNDFKPGMMTNKGIVEELDELQDAEALKQLGLSEEVLSYIFLRRFGNKWGWTPVMVANDDMNAFAEGMIGLEEAWQVTQNRLVTDLYTSNPTLLDGNALFSNRTNTGSAANDNDLDSGGSYPTDAQWAAMETLYADIGGIATGRRVRGTLNVAYVPTGTPSQEARRTFFPLNTNGLESKSAESTANVGIYRGQVKVIAESELRVASAKIWYGLRNPTNLKTATVVRGYFNGFGEQGKRERWYDPETKTTWVSIEGRIATAVKNWRYAVKNKGEN